MFKRHFFLSCVLLSFVLLTGCGLPQSATQTTAIAGAQGPAGPPGLIFLGTYNASQQYVATDVVTYQGSTYVAIASSTGVAPTGSSASNADWAVLAQAGAMGAVGATGPQGVQGFPGPVGATGLTGAIGSPGPAGAQGQQGMQGPAGPIGLSLQSAYSAGQTYVPRDVVFYQGSSYFALAANTGVAPAGMPTSSVNWSVLAQAGTTGAAGAAGPQGPIGPQGLVGPIGPAGAPGQTGAQGLPGVAGAQGPSGPTGATGVAGPQGPVGPAGPGVATYLQGRRFGVQGDSFSALFGNAWQNVVSTRTGMTLTIQESHPGRRFDTAFECWGNPAVGGTPGAFTAGRTMSGVGGTCAGNSMGIADGTAFADSLSNVDIELIELGTNDTGVPLGQLGDATNAGTFYGNMRWVVETYLNAKPSLRLVLVTVQYNGFASASTAQLYANATVNYGNSIGVPAINMYTLGGVNAITAPVLLRDGVHPSDYGFANFYGPVVAQQLMQLF